MPYGMYISAAGADIQARRLQVLSNNLANVDTPGFKRELSVFQARHAEAIERGLDYQGSRSINDVGGGVSMTNTVTDFSPGSMRQTGFPADVAIQGDGFFVIEKDGQHLLTRAGNFHFAASGQLLTEQGFSVLSTELEPITINPGLPWKFREDGLLRQGSDATPLALVRPRSRGDLAKAGENLFLPLADTPPIPANERHVRPGYLELSTVQPAQEMMELIETSRAYEANVQLIQNQDHMLGELVNRVLRQ